MKQKKSSVAGRNHFSEQEIVSALEQFTQAGNVSVKDFTTAFQISAATFYNWKKRYRHLSYRQSLQNISTTLNLANPTILIHKGELVIKEGEVKVCFGFSGKILRSINLFQAIEYTRSKTGADS
ncbi:transposase [Chitinophaga oryziterrae]|uniref:Transposase n=1 Tax=Chitinophaga oryziterrae TaxID=1031224 RepID=A0A6N8J7K9_9BACT|nr:transposase [Chitinophaga oryziterrae]MVT41210.1 transposase [Chitinophaga oryziterrae]